MSSSLTNQEAVLCHALDTLRSVEAGVESSADQLLSEGQRGELRNHANLIWGIAETGLVMRSLYDRFRADG